MKKIICMLTAAAVFLLAGCQSSGTVSYIETAEKYLESNNIDSAIRVLNEGYSITGDESLKEMIDSIESGEYFAEQNEEADVVEEAEAQETDSETDTDENVTEEAGGSVNYIDRAKGIWRTEYGNMKITVTDTEIHFYAESTNSTQMHFADASVTCPVSSVINNAAVMSFEDSWMNKGVILLTFGENEITASITITEYAQNAMWNINTGTHTFKPVLVDVSSTDAQSVYSGTWIYSDWFDEAEISIDVSGNEASVNGTYSSYYFPDEGDTLVFEDVLFSAVTEIANDKAEFYTTDSYGNKLLLEFDFRKREFTDKTLKYLVCKCKEFNGQPVGVEIEMYRDSEEYLFETVNLINSHCEINPWYVDRNIFEQNGSMVHVSLDGLNLSVDYYSSNSGDYNQIAKVSETVDLTYAITDFYTVEIPFEDDGWGNSGTLELRFNDGNAGAMMKGFVHNLMTGARTEWGAASSYYNDYMWPLFYMNPRNALDGMTSEQKRELNIFLSNFSEAQLGSYRGSVAFETDKLISFAFLHNKINNGRKIIHDEGEMGISDADVNSTLNKFFGRTILEGTSFEWSHKNGAYYMPLASGASYAYFTVATSAILLYDNYYVVDFDIFFDDNNATELALAEWYSYTTDTAKALCSQLGSGRAIVEKTDNGYILMWYEEFN